MQHNTAANAEIADEETIKIMNPLNYIGKPGVNLPQTGASASAPTTATPHWQSPPS